MSDSDGGVYRELSEEMRAGLKNIYQQISSASAAGGQNPETLFNDASLQLQEIVRETEMATTNILDIVEKQLGLTGVTSSLLATLRARSGTDPELKELARLNDQLAQDLTEVLTALSFQDLTGQRIKKVMKVLSDLEKNVVELYVSSGLTLRAADRNPEKDKAEIRAETEKKMEEFREIRGSELKGPDANGATQAEIDSMLAQLGL